MGHEPFPVAVADVTLPFRCVDGGTEPGDAVAEQFRLAWPSYRRWFLHDGEESRPSYADSRDAVRAWMPEIYDDYLAYVARLPFRELRTIVFDHLVAPTAFYLRRDEFAAWFARPDLGEPVIGWHNRNSWRGTAERR